MQMDLPVVGERAHSNPHVSHGSPTIMPRLQRRAAPSTQVPRSSIPWQGSFAAATQRNPRASVLHPHGSLSSQTSASSDSLSTQTDVSPKQRPSWPSSVGGPDVGVVIGRLTDYKKGTPGWDTVRAAQVKVASDDPRAGWVDTDDINGAKKDLHHTKATVCAQGGGVVVKKMNSRLAAPRRGARIGRPRVPLRRAANRYLILRGS